MNTINRTRLFIKKLLREHWSEVNQIFEFGTNLPIDWDAIIEGIHNSSQTQKLPPYAILDMGEEIENKDWGLVSKNVDIPIRCYYIALLPKIKDGSTIRLIEEKLHTLRKELSKFLEKKMRVFSLPLINISSSNTPNKFFAKNRLEFISGFLEFKITASL